MKSLIPKPKQFDQETAREARERCLNVRLNAGLTQDQLADIAGISKSAITSIERGIRIPHILTLRRIDYAVQAFLASVQTQPLEAAVHVARAEKGAGKRGRKP